MKKIKTLPLFGVAIKQMEFDKKLIDESEEECKQCANPMLKGIHTCKPKQKIDKLELNDDSYLISKTTMKIAIEIGKEYGAEKASDIIFRALFRSH